MKTCKKKLAMIVIMAVMVLGLLAGGTSAEASAVTNVLKAPKAAKGSWVYNETGKRYRFSYSGEYAKKQWLKIKGKTYYFTKKGYVKKGMFKYKNRYYYLGETTGKLVTGWKTINGKKYYFWKSAGKGEIAGSAAVGKVKIASKYYYFSSKGVLQTGWIKIGSYYYYFRPGSGVMAKNTTIGNYKVDKYGRRIVPVTATKPVKTGKVDCWVGDSRTVGLGIANDISTKCIAKVGEGYSWYTKVAEAKLIAKLKKNPAMTVVFNLGVNDVANISKYISRYKSLMTKYPAANFYFMSVNPIDAKKYTAGWVTNKKITAFNAKLKEAFPSRYIDTYTYLKTKGFDTVDGLHYTVATYKKIYTYVLGKV